MERHPFVFSSFLDFPAVSGVIVEPLVGEEPGQFFMRRLVGEASEDVFQICPWLDQVVFATGD